MKKSDPEITKLRLEVDSGGCSGFQYKFSFDYKQPQKDDNVFETNGAKVVVDSTSLPLVKGCTIDFIDTMIKRGFSVKSNPNSDKNCSCGTSFSVKTPEF